MKTCSVFLSLVDRRYQGVDFNTYHLLKSLVYFEDAEEEPMTQMIKPVKWEVVRELMMAEVRRPSPSAAVNELRTPGMA